MTKITSTSVTAQVRFLLSENPFCDNEDLYNLTKAISVKEKNTVRQAKKRILDQIQNKDVLNKLRANLPLNEKVRILPSLFTEFVKNCFPYTILYKWQYELFKHLEENDMSLIVVARDHGKSVLLVMYIEYLLDVKKMDVMLLGWTDRRKQLAEFIYVYFLRNNLITTESVVKNTANHFKTKDGNRFDCYGLKDKAILGMHADIYGSKQGLCLIIDDPIDESFEMYPSKERDLENRWESTIANINPNKTIICGTRKFEGDFLDYIQKSYKDKIAIFFRTPINADGSLLCPERWTFEKLAQKRAEIGEYRYSSEYLGNPQPLTGGVWTEDNIHWASEVKKWSEYEAVCIALDPAWTTNKESAFSSIITIFKSKEKEKKREYIVFDEDSGKYNFDDILKRIETAFIDIREVYKNIKVTVAIEENAGGKFLIEIAKARNYEFVPYIIEVHHSRAKQERIMSLEVPIINGTIRFMNSLRKKEKRSELIWEILTFPNCKKLDAIDALAMGFTELEKMRRRTFHIYRKSIW